jgi:hypothetical protein
MKIINLFLVLIFCLYQSNSQAKPRCETLYSAIYNDTVRKDVNKPTVSKEKDIGIRLETYWNEVNIDEPWMPKYLGFWKLKENKDGYFSVGKKTQGFLDPLINIGDLVISINDIDLRKLAEDKDTKRKMRDNISNLFDEGEEIKFKILTLNKNNKKKEIKEIKYTYANLKTPIKNKKVSYDAPMIDFYVNAIELNEKEGTFDASIETIFKERLDKRYVMTELVFENLVYDRRYDNETLTDAFYETCSFNEERFGKLNSVDPKYGIKFDNIYQEYKHLKTSEYSLTPIIKKNKNKDGYNLDEVDLEYRSSSVFKIKNNFNLKTFPFDKQKINIYLRAHLSNKDIKTYRSDVSSRTYRKALEFKDLNQIQGWNITGASTKYKIYESPLDAKYYDGFELVFDIERKTGYYISKIILPIILILAICWSAVWINPKEIESRLTVTIVCLLSLIAYNFVIDSELPKLEYLTIMDYIILISYIYAAIPNFLSIYSFQNYKTNRLKVEKFEYYEKRYGLLSYIILIFIIIIVNATNAPEHTNSMFTWAAMR